VCPARQVVYVAATRPAMLAAAVSAVAGTGSDGGWPGAGQVRAVCRGAAARRVRLGPVSPVSHRSRFLHRDQPVLLPFRSDHRRDGVTILGVTPFRSFAAEDFLRTSSWQRLDQILTGTGGCYGLYGSRGAGKTWLMRMVIEQANEKKGMGLWFPCPSEYDASAFLATLSDNLANAVERRFVRNRFWTVARRLRPLLLVVISVPIVVAVIAYVVHGLRSSAPPGTVFSAIPVWLWLVVAGAIALLVALYAAQVAWESLPKGRLVLAASALRDRIRYTARLRLGSDIEVSGGTGITGRLRRSSERELDERPATIASLVFDFRNLAELIVKTLKRPLVIGIDELDKIERPEAVLKLLRDIKGVFEITGVHFLVSVSAEAAAALRLGPLQTTGRNEFNSSFYTVIELPPLDLPDTVELLSARTGITAYRGQLLCLLGAGNFREIVRLAEHAIVLAAAPEPDQDLDTRLLISTVAQEADGLLQEVIAGASEDREDRVSSRAAAGAWRALPADGFGAVDSFAALSKMAIHEYWLPTWSDDQWERVVQESWRRFLVRLFVVGSLISHQARSTSTKLSVEEVIDDLRDVMIMATRSASVAKLMLEARFGDDLSSPYRASADARRPE
jgi:hypothetical protein